MAKKKAKNNISVGLIKGNHISNTTKPDVELFKSQVLEGEKADKLISPALIISALDHPVDITYGDAVIRLSPRAKLKVGDCKKVQKDLPLRVYLKKITKLK